MLKLENISKEFKVGKNIVSVLKKINISFKKNELVFILGSSGSGKSTLLNIMGGFLKPSSGNIFLGKECISSYNDKKMDNYRNNVVGNIFQNYNLIEYMTVLSNIKLCQGKISNRKLDILLKQLGIYDKKNVIISKLSGGEKQRVAIARALINDPKIILCDEPTGALDSANSIKIMEILKKISINKLVIVVSHDNYLANKYADRIIHIKDGEVLCQDIDFSQCEVKIDKKKISFLNIFKLSLQNLMLNKKRTMLTAIASSIGIICMMLVMNLAVGLRKEIKVLEKEMVSMFPIVVQDGEYSKDNTNVKSSNDKILIKRKEDYVHTNKIDKEYINFINNIDEIEYIDYRYNMFVPLVTDKYKFIDFDYFSSYIRNIDNYEIIYGKDISNMNEILLKLDSNNNLSNEILNSFGIDSDIGYKDIVGRKIRVILNDNYYVDNGDYFSINNDILEMYNKSELELTIVGIVKEKEIVDDNNYLLYNHELIDYIISRNADSLIVNSQLDKNYSVLNNQLSKDEMLSYLGYKTIPNVINIYVNSINNKNIVLDRLSKYSKKIIYEDTLDEMISVVNDFVGIISLVLVVFSFISIIISSFMISILTNMRVVERKREIGIFRSLGASRRDIKKIFNIENIIISLLSFSLGLLFIYIIKEPINHILFDYLGSDKIFMVSYDITLLVAILNMIIMVLSGLLPARKASKLEIVECIRNN